MAAEAVESQPRRIDAARGEAGRGVFAQRGLLEAIRTQQQRGLRHCREYPRPAGDGGIAQLCQAVEAGEADRCRRLRCCSRRIRRQRVREARARQAQHALAVAVLLGGRRRDGIADEQVHVRQAGGAEPVAPARLQRRQSRGEGAQPVAGRVTAEIEQHADALARDTGGEALVVQFADLVPGGGKRAKRRRLGLAVRMTREQHDANAAPRQRAQHRQHQARDRPCAEARRVEAEAIRVTTARRARGHAARMQGRGGTRALPQCGGIGVRAEMGRDQRGTRDVGRLRIEFTRALESGDRVLRGADVLQDVAVVEEGAGVVAAGGGIARVIPRLREQLAGRARLAEQRQAAVVHRTGMLRIARQHLLGAGPGLVETIERQQHRRAVRFRRIAPRQLRQRAIQPRQRLVRTAVLVQQRGQQLHRVRVGAGRDDRAVARLGLGQAAGAVQRQHLAQRPRIHRRQPRVTAATRVPRDPDRPPSRTARGCPRPP